MINIINHHIKGGKWRYEKNIIICNFTTPNYVLGGLVVKTVLPAPAAGEATVVVHFHKWDEDYENVGGHSWGGEVLVEVGGEYQKLGGSVQPTGKDDFGIYFTYRFEAGATAPDLGFIPVMADKWNENGTINPDWNKN